MLVKVLARGGLARSFSAVAAGWRPTPTTCVRILALNNIRDVPGAMTRKRIVGRGPGSGLGKTCGKGTKGTYQRHRLRKRGFEGGQTKLWKRTPKHGFIPNPATRRVLKPLGIMKLLLWIAKGRVDSKQPITMKALKDSRILGGSMKYGVRLLARDHEVFKREYPKLGLPPPRLVVSDVTPKAREAIESVGGSVELVFMSRIPLRAHLKPEKYITIPRGSGVPRKKYWTKYGFKQPEDRMYRGTEKRRTFPNRI